MIKTIQKTHGLLSVISLLSLTITPVFAKQDQANMPSSTTLHETALYKATRQGRHFIINLKEPHKVLSTSDINGGQVDDLEHIVNFQSVEGRGHDSRFAEILGQTHEQYHQALAQDINVDPKQMASMGTAANINNLAHGQKTFRDITIDAYVTAGVKGNALRAGDGAHWYQGAEGNERVTTSAPTLINKSYASQANAPVKDFGTINIILMVNRSLTSGALAKAVSIMTEAKSAALSELAIPSTQSRHLATGTGTDQYAIAAPLSTKNNTIDSASGHLKFGELIGSVVHEAVIEAIALQNGLERSDTRHIVHALKRFGGTSDYLVNALEKELDKDSFDLFKKNKKSVFKDAKLVAAAYAYAALLDRLEYQTLSRNIERDVLLDQAVNAAIAVSGKSQHWQDFRQQFEFKQDHELDLFIQAIAIGWKAKWAN